MKLYTVGYLGWKIDLLADCITSLGDDFRIYDVRHSPYARDKQFCQAGFIGKFGDKYVHAKGLGNVNYRGGPIKLVDPEPWYRFAKRDMENGLPVILMCACWNLAECHRLMIAKELEKRFGVIAEHLAKVSIKARKPKENLPTLF